MIDFVNYTGCNLEVPQGRENTILMSKGKAVLDKEISMYNENGFSFKEEIPYKVSGLPKPKDCIMYIVTEDVLHWSSRTDLVSVWDMVETDNENMFKCKGFIIK